MGRDMVLVYLVTAFLFVFLSSGDAATTETNPTVIVVGAGMSGISAAKRLSEAGIKNILILEATNRIGGRICKTSFGGGSVEVGANWVQGVGGPKTNPIWKIAKNISLTTFISEFDGLPSNTYKQTGGLYKKSVAQKAYDLADELNDFSTNISKSLPRGEDIPILVAQRLANHVPSTPLEMGIDYYHYDYEFAEPPRVTSLRSTHPLRTFEDFGDNNYFVADPRGYESTVYHLAKQFLTTDKAGNINDTRLKLNKVVNKIKYSATGVTVTTEDGSTYNAKYVMVSVSIGVLQTQLIDFVPDLPKWKLIAMYQLDMSIYTKIFLKFPYKFWPTGNGTEFFMYTNERRGYYTMWQQLEREYPGSNMLLVTVTDDESRRIEQQKDSETKSEIMAVLRDMFGSKIPNATDILVPRWWSNRFYKGTYSNWPIGVTRYEYDQIRAPIGKVYFTGEHTSAGYNGYVHGAYLAGINSANLMIKCVQKRACTYTIRPKYAQGSLHLHDQA